jgi:hypothetical protein
LRCFLLRHKKIPNRSKIATAAIGTTTATAVLALPFSPPLGSSVGSMAEPVVDVADVDRPPVGRFVAVVDSVTVVYAVLVIGGGALSSGVEELSGGGLEVLDVGGGSSELVGGGGGGELVVDGGGGGGSSEVDVGGGGGGSSELVVGGGGGVSEVDAGGSGAGVDVGGTSSSALVLFDMANL